MSNVVRLAPHIYRPVEYWEERARRFGRRGAGLAAVCSYGMPQFYNRAVDWTQRRALSRWLKLAPGARVLDVGCGIGRWSRRLAARGAHVTGVDLSPTMIDQARWRTADAGLAGRCLFFEQDLTRLKLRERFDLVLGVTVLQHILDARALDTAVRRLAQHLKPSGLLLLLEAAPVQGAGRCGTSVFVARPRAEYLRLFAASGLEVEAVIGVDPTPIKLWLLPRLLLWPRWLSVALLALSTAISLPIDLLLGPHASKQSWHALFVLHHTRRSSHAI